LVKIYLDYSTSLNVSRGFSMKEEKHNNSGRVGSLANYYSAKGQNARLAGDALRTGEQEVRELVQNYTNCTNEQVGGRVAEVWHKSTFKADAALKNGHELDVIIGPKGGVAGKGSADLTVLKNGAKVEEAGLKYYNKANETAFNQSNVFDQGRQKICPSDQVANVKKYSAARAESGALKSPQYSDTAKNVTDKLTHENVQSKPLSKSESVDLVSSPSRLGQEALKVEIGQAAKGGALLGGGIGLWVSVLSNISSCVDGDKEVGEAVVDVAVDTVKASVQGAAVGAGGAVVRNQLLKSGAKGLAKGSLPVVVAASALEAGTGIAKDFRDLCNGKIDGGDFVAGTVIHTGKAAVKGGASWGGAELGTVIGTVAFGPIGAVVGGFAGGILGYMFGNKVVG
jgi:hypothetical protein